MIVSGPISPKNAEIARLRELARQRRARSEAGRFLVEGTKLTIEALRSELAVCDVWVDADHDLDPILQQCLDDAALHPRLVGRGGVARFASTTSPQPVVAEVEVPTPDTTILNGATAVLVAADVNDPGNLGTLMRSALAAGFDAIVALGDTTDPFSPKSVRAAAGATFRLPVIVERSAADGFDLLTSAGLRVIGTRMTNATDCDQADLLSRVALVVGNEAHGLAVAFGDRVDDWVRIPMAGDVESLNVAMAATVLTYEVARQRRNSA